MIPPLVLYLMPIAILVIGGLVVMMADAFQKTEGGLAIPTALLHFAAAASAFALWRLAGMPATGADATHVLGNWLVFDRTTLFLDMVIALGGLLASLLAGGYLAEHGLERGEFFSLVTFASAGCMMLAGANDLMMLFIGLETLSLGVYALTGFRRTSPRSTEGALKYFLLGSFAAALLLYGSALLYGITGHTDFAGIRQGLTTPLLETPTLQQALAHATDSDALRRAMEIQQTVHNRIGLIAMVLILVALAFKISAVPFHMWTPDAYEGAPTPVAAYMAVSVKAAAFGALLRVMLGIFGDPITSASIAGGWVHPLAWIAVLTMSVGNLIAIAQSSVKRMLAYSSIAHAGYILLGVVISPRTDMVPGTNLTVGQAGIAAVLFYLLAYTVSNAGAFGSLILAGRNQREAVTYEDIAGLGKRHPAAALAMTFFILSLTGVPPTVGFFAKFYVIRATIDAGYNWLAIIAMINSVVAAYYYLRVLSKMYMHDPAPGAPRAEPMQSGFVAITLVAAAVLVIYLGLAPGRYLDLAVEAVRQAAS